MCVCVTWALGREVPLPYDDQLRSRLVTSPLSLLLTKIKGVYEPQLSLPPPTSHSFSLSDKVMSASFSAICLLDPVASLRRALPPLPANCVDTVAGPSLVIPKWTITHPGRAPLPTTTGAALILSSVPLPGIPKISACLPHTSQL
jgi:hypothetical protein